MSIDRRARRGLALSTAALAFALFAGGADLSAQGHLVTLGGSVNHGAMSVFPRSGAPGTTFKMAPQGLPPNTPVQIMMGALRSGFEVVQTITTDDSGRLGGRDTIVVTVPSWVETDKAYLVMLTDTNYNPLAAADMFHPTKPDGSLVRRGMLKQDPSGCTVLTSEGGEIYMLTGDKTQLMMNKEMVVHGKVVPTGACGNVTTIDVRTATLPPR